MNLSLSSFFFCPSVVFVVFLLFAIWRFFYREKYALSFSKLPDANKERFVKSEQNLAKLFRTSLWLTPLYLVILPLVLYIYSRDIFLVATVCMILLVAVLWEEYSFHKWLFIHLTSGKISDKGLAKES
jgi:cobalamin synthase